MTELTETKTVTLDVTEDGLIDGLQLSINVINARGVGDGYQISGPKFNGTSKLVLSVKLDARDAVEIVACLRQGGFDV